MDKNEDAGLKKSLFEPCACSTHCFEIQRFTPTSFDSDEGFYLNFWSLGRSSERLLSWRERIKWIWTIIRKGSVESDSIIINNSQAKEISEYINKHLSKEK